MPYLYSIVGDITVNIEVTLFGANDETSQKVFYISIPYPPNSIKGGDKVDSNLLTTIHFGSQSEFSWSKKKQDVTTFFNELKVNIPLEKYVLDKDMNKTIWNVSGYDKDSPINARSGLSPS